MDLNGPTSFIVVFNNFAKGEERNNKEILSDHLKQEGLEGEVTLGKYFNTLEMMEMRTTPDIAKKLQDAPNVKTIERNQTRRAL